MTCSHIAYSILDVEAELVQCNRFSQSTIYGSRMVFMTIGQVINDLFYVKFDPS